MHTTTVELSDGETAVIQVAHAGDREQDVALRGHTLEEFVESARGLLRDLAEPLRATMADEVSVEMGIAATVEQGKLTALLVAGSAEAALKVTMTWKRSSAS